MDDMTKQILTTAAGSVVRHAMTTAAGALVTDGLVQAGDSDSFVKIGSGIVMGLGALGLSWWQKSGQAQVTAMLKKMTDKKTTTAAVATAQALPTGAAVTAALALFAVLLTSLGFAQTAHAQTATKRLPAIELGGPCNPLGDTRASCQAQGIPAPAGQQPSAAAVPTCNFGTFTLITPQNIVATIQACGEKLLTDSQAALDSATAAKDNTAISCLTPGTALFKAGVGIPGTPGDPTATPPVPAVAAQLGGPILLFQKYREFIMAGGLNACESWVNTVVAAQVGSAAGAVGAVAGAALLVPK